METRNNTGAIFKNDNKTSDKHPDYKGKVLINEKNMEISLWLNTSAKGVKYFSAVFSEPYVKTSGIVANFEEEKFKEYEQEDDLPF
jgi:uncharacterized protein (DUF736 family)